MTERRSGSQHIRSRALDASLAGARLGV